MTTPDSEQELAWLQDSFPSETADLKVLLDAVLKTVAPLAQALATHIVCESPAELPPVTGQLVALRQALLNLLTGAIHAMPGGTVQIEIAPHCRGLEVRLRAEHETAERTSRDESESVEHFIMARQFVCLFGGTLDVIASGDEAGVVAAMVLPIAEQTTVLVIEDNADTLQLLQRYLAGTRYRFIGTRSPEQAGHYVARH